MYPEYVVFSTCLHLAYQYNKFAMIQAALSPNLAHVKFAKAVFLSIRKQKLPESLQIKFKNT